jgi:hypothetical protein
MKLPTKNSVRVAFAVLLLTGCCAEKDVQGILILERADIPQQDCEGSEWDEDGSGPEIRVDVHYDWKNWIYSSYVYENDFQPLWEEEASGTMGLSQEEWLGKEITIVVYEIDEDEDVEIGRSLHEVRYSDLNANEISIGVDCLEIYLSFEFRTTTGGECA